MLTMRRVLILLLLLTPPAPAPAQIGVGDKADLKVRVLGGGWFALSEVRRSIVLLDFFAPWSPASNDHNEHRARIHADYGPRGLQILGICADVSSTGAIRLAREFGWGWPIHVDSSQRVRKAWGVDSVPRMILIGTSGRVLWIGPPEEVDEAIVRAFESDGPRLVPEPVLAEAMKWLEAAETQVREAPWDAAATLAKLPPGALKDVGVWRRWLEVVRDLESWAGKQLESAMESKDPAEMVGAIDRVGSVLALLPADIRGRPELQRKLRFLQDDPIVRELLERRARERRAVELLERAKQRLARGDNREAQALLRQLTTRFQGTPAAQEAAILLKSGTTRPSSG
jgi:hypothetical protein